MAFRVGQKVCCIFADDDFQIPGAPCGLIKGAIYTVRKTGLVHRYDPDALPCIEIEEEPGFCFWSHRFRPLVTKQTSIEVFTRMLLPSKKEVEA